MILTKDELMDYINCSKFQGCDYCRIHKYETAEIFCDDIIAQSHLEMYDKIDERNNLK